MKSANTKLLLVLFSFVVIFSCKKDEETDEPIPTTPDAFVPLVTDIGIPVGAANSATIGSGGGSIFSDDGRLEIVIPPNALSADIEITIQPVTNECPGGNGLAYDLSPDGIQFSEEVTLIFHYTDEDVEGSDPIAASIATQDDDNIWYSYTDSEVDIANSTVSISTLHFSIWTLHEGYSISPWEASVEVNEALQLVVYLTPTGPQSDDGGPTRVPLGTPAPMLVFQELISWSVNSFPGGTFNDGMMNPESGSSSATYTAPSNINNMTGNPVSIRALIDYGNNTSVSLISTVTVEELGEQYSLHFEQDYSMLNYTTPFCQLNTGYLDGFDVDITVTSGNVLTSNVSNFTPAINYNSVVCTCFGMTFNQGSVIEFSNFTAWFDGELLHYDYNFSWDGSDDVYQCDGDQATIIGTDFTDVDLGSLDLPSGEVVTIVQPWGIGTVTVTHVQ